MLRIVCGIEEAQALLQRSSQGRLKLPDSLRGEIRRLFGSDLSVEDVVNRIITAIAANGDISVRRYNMEIDGLKKEAAALPLIVSNAEIEAAYDQVQEELVHALRFAAERIQSYHKEQLGHAPSSFTSGDQKQVVRPLKRVGIYVPGTTSVYPSTVLMTAIPAKIAGVPEIIMTTPTLPDGTVSPMKLVAADIVGVDEIYRAGGAQGIAAMVYGTESLRRVDKICGPGNIFVTTAKKQVYGLVGVDGVFGPSETVVVADEMANADLVAADLLAAAEHDELAVSILITTSEKTMKATLASLENQCPKIERSGVARASLEARGVAAIVGSMAEATKLADEFAPEHLCLHVREAERVASDLNNAGAIFVGGLSVESIGDYVVGPSHLMPTGGSARFASSLGVQDFLKITAVVSLDEAALAELGPPAITIARAEGFQGHAKAIEQRLAGLE